MIMPKNTLITSHMITSLTLNSYITEEPYDILQCLCSLVLEGLVK
jgi:hypothetical protein